jgi:hypothetical protein
MLEQEAPANYEILVGNKGGYPDPLVAPKDPEGSLDPDITVGQSGASDENLLTCFMIGL